MRILVLAALILLFINGCHAQTRSHNKAVLSSDQYGTLKNNLICETRRLISSHKGPYYNKKYDSVTEIFIDTILISPDRGRFASLIITRIPNSRLSDSATSNGYHYDANATIGYMKRDSISAIIPLQYMTLSRFPTQGEASEEIRDLYFNRMIDLKNWKFQYNLGNSKFWDNKIWAEYDPK